MNPNRYVDPNLAHSVHCQQYQDLNNPNHMSTILARTQRPWPLIQISALAVFKLLYPTPSSQPNPYPRKLPPGSMPRMCITITPTPGNCRQAACPGCAQRGSGSLEESRGRQDRFRASAERGTQEGQCVASAVGPGPTLCCAPVPNPNLS